MKHTIILLTILLQTHGISAQSPYTHKLDSIVSSSDTYDMKVDYEYNDDGNIENKSIYVYTENGWKGRDRYTYSYEGKRLVRMQSFANLQQTGDTKWELNKTTKYLYDSKGNILSETTTPAKASDYQPAKRTTYVYKEGTDQPVSVKTELQRGGMAWENTDDITYTYDAASRTIRVSHQHMDGGGMTENKRTETTYDAAGRKTEEQRYEFGKCHSVSKYKYADDDRLLAIIIDRYEIYSKENTGKLLGTDRYEIIYDNQGCTTTVEYFYRKADDDWMYMGSSNISYDFNIEPKSIMRVDGALEGFFTTAFSEIISPNLTATPTVLHEESIVGSTAYNGETIRCYYSPIQ